MTNPSIALMGCGKMGSALVHGWLTSGIAGNIDVLEPSPLPADLAANKIIKHHKDASSFKGAWDILIIAVKPQIMDDACAAISIPATTPVLSIAAGQTIASFQKRFDKRQPIIRAMPNTPAAIGKGITVACVTNNVTSAQKQLANALLSSCGSVEWVSDEKLMDAVTAVSGSGPAYVFLLIETLAASGVKAGLPQDLALKLARETVIGSAALAEVESKTSPAQLRENVTSPNGTTAAALFALMDGRLQKLFDDAIEKAANRSRELSR